MNLAVRSMALSIPCELWATENRWLVQAKVDLKEGARRISLMRNNLTSLPPCPRCPELEVFLLQGNAGLNRVSENFFRFTPALKVLDLSQTAVEDLPSISSLLNLQNLNVSDTSIKSLPKELRKLTKLRFLLLSRTPIKTIDEGVIAKLTQLQALFVDFSYGNWRVSTGWTGLDMDELKELRRLKALGITVERFAVLRKLAKSCFSGCMRNLRIRRCKDGLTGISRRLLRDGLKGVRMLEVRDCREMKELVIDRHEWYLQNVRSLQFRGLPSIEIVWKEGGRFRNLSELRVCSCDGLEAGSSD